MFALSRLEWLVLAAALLLCPGFTWSIEPGSRAEFGTVVAQPAPQQGAPSAAAGGSAPPKKQE